MKKQGILGRVVNEAYLSIGSNLGDKKSNLDKQLLHSHNKIEEQDKNSVFISQEKNYANKQVEFMIFDYQSAIVEVFRKFFDKGCILKYYLQNM